MANSELIPVSSLSDIPTPALILDVAALDRNIARMAAFFANGDCRLRPHVKAHKTPEIARRQLAAGSCSGLTCATVFEAEQVAHLSDDILIANELVDPRVCDRAARVAASLRARAPNGRLTVAVDSSEGLQALSSAARNAGVEIGILVDVNVGQNRCGVTPGDEAVRLARQVMDAPGIVLRGLMGYEGHVQPIRAREDRESAARSAMRLLVDSANALRSEGLPCDVVSAGGTGTFDISGRVPGVTEIQAGSYALMDSDYAAVGVPFEQAFWVLGTVVSAPTPDRCVIDAGHKSLTKDHGMPSVAELPNAVVTALNDEHTVIALDAYVGRGGNPVGSGGDNVGSGFSRTDNPSGARIGDRLRLVPSHTDPTINLHDNLYVIDCDSLIDVWPIARGCGR
jgi:D-serine deaminase-like pyridoxal phosphate-dependent protein